VKKNITTAMIARAATPEPTPMPTIAPVERDEGLLAGVGEELELEIAVRLGEDVIIDVDPAFVVLGAIEDVDVGVGVAELVAGLMAGDVVLALDEQGWQLTDEKTEKSN
jgi:hypothetical protein